MGNSAFTVSGPPGTDGATGATGPGFLTDTQANRPAAATAGEGAVFIPSDGYPPSRSTGAAWVVQHPLGFACSNPPAAGSFTKVGGGSGDTLVADGDGLLLTEYGTASANESACCWVVAVPSAPYTFTVGLDLHWLYPLAWSSIGLTLVDGTSNPKRANLGLAWGTSGALYLSIAKWNSLTSWNANYLEALISAPGSHCCLFLKIRDDNTNRYYDLSQDGRNWINVYSVGRTDFLTPTHIGLECRQVANVASTKIRSQAKINHWSLA